VRADPGTLQVSDSVPIKAVADDGEDYYGNTTLRLSHSAGTLQCIGSLRRLAELGTQFGQRAAPPGSVSGSSRNSARNSVSHKPTGAPLAWPVELSAATPGDARVCLLSLQLR
jgi:hypothetical protein